MHWACICVDVKLCRIEYYDSLPSSAVNIPFIEVRFIFFITFKIVKNYLQQEQVKVSTTLIDWIDYMPNVMILVHNFRIHLSKEMDMIAVFLPALMLNMLQGRQSLTSPRLT